MPYSCNDNQNYFVQKGRTTSRVLAPPGGQTSLTFGLSPPKPEKKENNLAPLLEKKGE
jgi:hypothetical protein